jgi:hypothetical protein
MTPPAGRGRLAVVTVIEVPAKLSAGMAHLLSPELGGALN